MSESTETTPPPFDWDNYEEYAADEGDGELGDPALGGLEIADDEVRALWTDWHCKRRSGTFAEVKFYGKSLPVPEPAYDAYVALERALRAAGYPTPEKSGTYLCRHISDTWEQRQIDAKGGNCGSPKAWSLHAYGLAIDIDEDFNPFSAGDRYSGRMKEHHVDSVLRIKNTAGQTLWEWGGKWSTPDRMHFQIDQGPNGASVDWATVPGSDVKPATLDGATHTVKVSTALNMRNQPTTSGSTVIARLPNGTSVAALDEPMRESGEHQWLKIKAPVGSQIVEGWVAGDFLLPPAGTKPPAGRTEPPSTDATVADGITHRVNTRKDDLNLRSHPSLTAGIVAELPKGLGVSVLAGSGEDADNHHWVKIRASLGGQTHEGWVADDFIAPA